MHYIGKQCIVYLYNTLFTVSLNNELFSLNNKLFSSDRFHYLGKSRLGVWTSFFFLWVHTIIQYNVFPDIIFMKMFINILILPAEKLTFTQPNAPAPPARYGKVKVTGVRHGEYLLFSFASCWNTPGNCWKTGTIASENLLIRSSLMFMLKFSGQWNHKQSSWNVEAQNKSAPTSKVELWPLGLRMVSFVYKIVLCTDKKKSLVMQ
jgi:hypothetical protein